MCAHKVPVRARVFWVDVEGIIGAGKTELMRILVPRLKEEFGVDYVMCVPEDVEVLLKSGLFQKYQQNPERFAYQFQTMFFHTRTMTFLTEWDKLCKRMSSLIEEGDHEKTIVIVSERSILSDAVFMDVQYEQCNVTWDEWNDYRQLNAMWTRLYPVRPGAIIYCRPGGSDQDIINEADRRIKERAREAEEKLVNKDYNGVVHAMHEAVFGKETYSYQVDGEGTKEIPVIHFDTTANYRDNADVALRASTNLSTQIAAIITASACNGNLDVDLNPSRGRFSAV